MSFIRNSRGILGTYIVDLSGAADDIAFVAVVAVFVPFAALLVVGTAFPVPKIIKYWLLVVRGSSADIGFCIENSSQVHTN